MSKQSRKRIAGKIKSHHDILSLLSASENCSDIEDEAPLKDPKQMTRASNARKGLLASMASIQKSSTANVSKKEPLNTENIKAVMSMLGIDFEKTVETKRKKIEKVADDVIEKHQERLSKLLKSKDEANVKQLDELKNKLSVALKQCEKDLLTNKEQETKASKLFDQQINLIQHAIEQEKRRIQALRHLSDIFAKALQEMESTFKSETKNLNSEFHKDVEKVQKILNKENARQVLMYATKSLFKI